MPSKDYNAWHTRKADINCSTSHTYFYEREVWWTAVGLNVGDEEDGKGYNFARPVLIMRKFNRSLFYGLPLSSAIKSGKYYYPVQVKDRQNIVLLSHLRDYDAKRLINKLGVINKDEFGKIQIALSNLLQE